MEFFYLSLLRSPLSDLTCQDERARHTHTIQHNTTGQMRVCTRNMYMSRIYHGTLADSHARAYGLRRVTNRCRPITPLVCPLGWRPREYCTHAIHTWGHLPITPLSASTHPLRRASIRRPSVGVRAVAAACLARRARRCVPVTIVCRPHPLCKAVERVHVAA